jgi:ribokinase
MPVEPAEVVTLGDVNVDIVAHFDSFPVQGQDAFAHATQFHCGGSSANTAMALAGMGVETALIARVGVDPWASLAQQILSEAGVVLSGLQRDPAVMTGLMYILVTPDGDRTILGDRGANAHTDPGAIHEEALATAKLLHLSGYALLTEPQRSAANLALEVAHRHGLTVSLDPGLSGAPAVADRVWQCLPRVDILLPNLAEARQLTGLTAPRDCVQALEDVGVGAVAMKLGRDGALAYNGKDLFQLPRIEVETQDSTGAGDSFAAGLIAGLIHGLKWPAALMLGNAMGAVAAARVGGGSAAPMGREVLALLDGCRDEPAFRLHRTAVVQATDLARTLTKEAD